jgi:hypothetical protein
LVVAAMTMAAATSKGTAAPGGLATLRLKSTLFQDNPVRCSFPSEFPPVTQSVEVECKN